jgi:hypothetical protein
VLDKELVNKILSDLDALDKIMNPYISELIEIMQTIDEPKTAARIAMTEKRIKQLIEELSLSFEEFSILSATQAYKDGRVFAAEILKLETLSDAAGVDSKAIKALIRDMNFEFNSKLEGFTTRTSQVMKAFSKQGAVTESEISLLVAQGYIDKQTGWEAKKLLRAKFSETGEILDDSKLAQYIERKIKAEKLRISKLSVSEKMKETLYAKEVEKLKNGQFMQIIDKNGDIRTYKVDTYADLVSRTRLADAQVTGTIEESEANGVYVFTVTAHNTQTAICKPHENKTYTTNKTLIDAGVFKELTQETRPTYHVNCQHRIVPKAFSSVAMDRLLNRSRS